MTERERCAGIAKRKWRRLKATEKRLRTKGDESGARRASIGATIAAALANEIRRSK